ncbi:hypothetical protein Airi02_046830 [Actinoallomurus iriomotensis]|jgi:hypothetical protein|uniref:Uncharacterized protein n=1 Tax=Actinoallomurus iriomotensis TaxID=478107 RepID=A0A9W6W0V6_9ACTN|nr:hypothetical protein Airi02_046830 [Actinoallomurus iriomotensis]
MVDMNDAMITVPSNASDVIDLCGAPLSEPSTGVAMQAMVARFAFGERKPQARTVGAFNSYI